MRPKPRHGGGGGHPGMAQRGRAANRGSGAGSAPRHYSPARTRGLLAEAASGAPGSAPAVRVRAGTGSPVHRGQTSLAPRLRAAATRAAPAFSVPGISTAGEPRSGGKERQAGGGTTNPSMPRGAEPGRSARLAGAWPSGTRSLRWRSEGDEDGALMGGERSAWPPGKPGGRVPSASSAPPRARTGPAPSGPRPGRAGQPFWAELCYGSGAAGGSERGLAGECGSHTPPPGAPPRLPPPSAAPRTGPPPPHTLPALRASERPRIGLPPGRGPRWRRRRGAVRQPGGAPSARRHLPPLRRGGPGRNPLPKAAARGSRRGRAAGPGRGRAVGAEAPRLLFPASPESSRR